MYDGELLSYVNLLGIPNFRGVKMRDELPAKPWKVESGILNLNTSAQKGSHWVSWYKYGKDRYYFDSFGERPPFEILNYLKTKHELLRDMPAIKCNAVTMQHDESNECGSLCLYILKLLSNGIPFSEILEELKKRYEKGHTTPLIIEI